jgi:methionine-rich copper-binding protein CopC
VLPPPATTRRAGPHLRRLARCALLVLGVVAMLATPAWAHVHLEGTDPEDGAHLDEAPPEVRVWFDQPVELLRGALTVAGEDGIRVDLGDADHAEGSPTEVHVSLPADLPPGEYTAQWRVQAADRHTQEGSWTFRVAEQAPEATDDEPAAGSDPAGGHTGGTDAAVPAAGELAAGEPQTALPVAMGLASLLAGLLAAGLAVLLLWRAGELGAAPRDPDPSTLRNPR